VGEIYDWALLVWLMVFGDDPKSTDVSLRDSRPLEWASNLIVSNFISQILGDSIWVSQHPRLRFADLRGFGELLNQYKNL